ncbi:uncharacterized protein LOC143019047 [Oratosquilla oratoria]|uniref:uncharacterized protein LOC143019047 n=1 Tax=Oratosquilla oratoria TaxID=337810 RepID=UPI003F763C65
MKVREEKKKLTDDYDPDGGGLSDGGRTCWGGGGGKVGGILVAGVCVALFLSHIGSFLFLYLGMRESDSLCMGRSLSLERDIGLLKERINGLHLLLVEDRLQAPAFTPEGSSLNLPAEPPHPPPRAPNFQEFFGGPDKVSSSGSRGSRASEAEDSSSTSSSSSPAAVHSRSRRESGYREYGERERDFSSREDSRSRREMVYRKYGEGEREFNVKNLRAVSAPSSSSSSSSTSSANRSEVDQMGLQLTSYSRIPDPAIHEMSKGCSTRIILYSYNISSSKRRHQE